MQPDQEKCTVYTPSPVRHLHVRKTKKVQLNFIYNLSHLASIDLSNNWQNIDVIFFLE